MKTYLVGGAVRDKLLDYPSDENDWVVVGGSPQKMIDLGYQPVGQDFPVFINPKSGEEYALARTERKSGHGYQGFSFHTAPDISLEDDLVRRDLTINAMAEDENGEIIDPYGGRQDLNDKLLRHVSDAFTEDPLRVLRVARFAARYHHMGFTIAPETMALMQNLVSSGELAHLVAERLWKETERALCERSPDIYIQVLRDCGALAQLFPEVEKLFGVPQRADYHPEVDTGIHTLMSLQQNSPTVLESGFLCWSMIWAKALLLMMYCPATKAMKLEAYRWLKISVIALKYPMSIGSWPWSSRNFIYCATKHRNFDRKPF